MSPRIAKSLRYTWTDLRTVLINMLRTGRRPAVATVSLAATSLAPLLMAMAIANPAGAQESMAQGPPGGYYHAERPYNVEHGFWHDHSSTAAEGFYRGLSAYIQSLGIYEVHHAQANILNEQAEWLDYENSKKRVETFYDRRRLRQKWLAEQRAADRQRELQGRQLLQQRQATTYRRAYLLSSEELDRSTGQIAWPAALTSDEFAPYRDRLESLFARRAQYNLAFDANLIRQIELAHEQFKQSLQDYFDIVPPQQYLAAQRFLRGLLYEAMYPPTLG